MSELVCVRCGVGTVGGDWELCDACAEEERARESMGE